MKTAWLFIFLFGFRAVYAHNPNVAGPVIYEQNGKSFLRLKSSLTAFEEEHKVIVNVARNASLLITSMILFLARKQILLAPA